MIKSFNIQLHEPICKCKDDALVLNIIQEDKIFKFSIKCGLCGINVNFPAGGFAYEFSFDSSKPLRTINENKIFVMNEINTKNSKIAEAMRKDIRNARIFFFTLLFLMPIFVYIKTNVTFFLFLISLILLFLSNAYINDAKLILKSYYE